MVSARAALLAALAAGVPAAGGSKRQAIKVVPTTEPTTTTPPGTMNREHIDYKLVPSRKHPAFAGPAHLKDLHGVCFETIVGSYEWRVCPFDNVTQHEVNAAWNPYNGILGVWDSYELTDGNFSHMTFTDGDGCSGDIKRQAKVLLQCGAANSTVEPTEPSTCHYEIKFITPLACHNMTVREALKEVDRKRLRDLDMELEHDEITQLGHTNRVTRLLKAAGVFPTPKAADATTTMETMTEPSTTASAEVMETTVEEVEETTLDVAAHADARAAALEDQVTALTTLVGELRRELDALKSAESPVATGITTEKKATKKAKTTATAAKRAVSAGAAKDVDKSARPTKAHPKVKATATHTKSLHASSSPTKAKKTVSKPTVAVKPQAAAAKANAPHRAGGTGTGKPRAKRDQEHPAPATKRHSKRGKATTRNTPAPKKRQTKTSTVAVTTTANAPPPTRVASARSKANRANQATTAPEATTKKTKTKTKKKKHQTAKVVTPTHLTPTVERKKGPSTKPKARPTKKPTKKPTRKPASST